MSDGGNVIFITGGGTGIGRALAEALAKEGHRVVIAGRSRETLDAVVAANTGISLVELDVTDPVSIAAAAATIVRDHPQVNVLINNAGIMKVEHLKDGDPSVAEVTVATNLLGPIRMTAALMSHLLAQPSATIINVSAGLAFVPMAPTPTYNATKAAIHSYTETLREQLKDTGIKVLEIIPPYVQSTLLNPEGLTDEHAMPVDEFVSQTIAIFHNDPEREIVVDAVKPLRFAEADGKYDEMFEKNNAIFA